MTRIEDINKASIEHASEVDEAYKYTPIRTVLLMAVYGLTTIPNLLG